MLKFYKNSFKIYFQAKTTKTPKIYIKQGDFVLLGEMKKIDDELFEFEDNRDYGEYIYKIEVEFVKYVRVVVEKNLLSKLYNHTFGNWEIKNNQMIFYDLEGKELVKFDLFNSDGEPAEFGIVKRVRC